MTQSVTAVKTQPGNKLGYFYLSLVYVVWGSTYLAIRVAVRDGAGFTPFVLGAMRVLAAGLILLAYSMITRQRMRLTQKEFFALAGSGLLLWLGGNGLVMLGEIRVDSGLAALIISSTPFWAAVLGAILDRKIPSLLLIGSLVIGATGIVVLSMPYLLSGVSGDILSVGWIVIACLCWAGGSVMQSRFKSDLSTATVSGYQQLIGGVGFIFLALLMKEPLPTPIPEAWAAWAYLLFFGSIITFTAYIQVLRILPTNLVMTYPYVNPIIAVILGWLILGEQITIWTVAGAILVLLGVYLSFRAHAKEQAVLSGS